jgi:hypothetical protein
VDIPAETESFMHLHDQAVEHFQALQPHFFTSFARLDLREHYSFEVFEMETLLQLWLRADNTQEVKKPFLHLSCYGVERRRDFTLLWPLHLDPLQIRITSIRHAQLHGLFFEVSSFDVGYDDYNPLFSCRTFEANLEETC